MNYSEEPESFACLNCGFSVGDDSDTCSSCGWTYAASAIKEKARAPAIDGFAAPIFLFFSQAIWVSGAFSLISMLALWGLSIGLGLSGVIRGPLLARVIGGLTVCAALLCLATPSWPRV